MGYYTQFTLNIESGVEEHEKEAIITKLRSSCEYAEFALDEEGSTNEEAKWYDNEKDMRAFSKEFPKVLFKLSGTGEESGDFWEKYFQNGKMQRCNGSVVYDEFDEKKME